MRITQWADFVWTPSLLNVFARPGTLISIEWDNGVDYPALARERGAATFFLDLKLKDWVGTPRAPVDPNSPQKRANAMYRWAVVGLTGNCPTPLIVENEFFGARAPTPWTTAEKVYRVNVLTYLEDLAADGARPVLLVSSRPFTGSAEAVAWWRAVSQMADLVREVYLPATAVWKLGPVKGSRLLRAHYRQSIQDFSSIGIPAQRLWGSCSAFSATEGSAAVTASNRPRLGIRL